MHTHEGLVDDVEPAFGQESGGCRRRGRRWCSRPAASPARPSRRTVSTTSSKVGQGKRLVIRPGRGRPRGNRRRALPEMARVSRPCAVCFGPPVRPLKGAFRRASYLLRQMFGSAYIPPLKKTGWNGHAGYDDGDQDRRGLCGMLLIFLLGGWVAETIYHSGGHYDRGAGLLDRHRRGTARCRRGSRRPEVPFAEVYAAADAGAGERLWRQCAACHAVEEGANGTGPHLGTSSAATRPPWTSSAIPTRWRSMESDWTPENLSAFIENPRDYRPARRCPITGCVISRIVRT